MTSNSEGSITKGVLLNVGLNLFICLIWIPLCSIGGGYNSSSVAAQIGSVFFFAGVLIGISQAIHVVPLSIYLHRQGQRKTLIGMLRAAAVVFGLWLLIWLVAILAG